MQNSLDTMPDCKRKGEQVDNIPILQIWKAFKICLWCAMSIKLYKSIRFDSICKSFFYGETSRRIKPEPDSKPVSKFEIDGFEFLHISFKRVLWPSKLPPNLSIHIFRPPIYWDPPFIEFWKIFRPPCLLNLRVF